MAELPAMVVHEGSDDWSALYVDGRLETVGDHYLIDERIRHLCQVETIQSDDFLRGGKTYADVAQTLGDIQQWQRDRAQTAQDAERRRMAEEAVDHMLALGAVQGDREELVRGLLAPNPH